jgi:hypothetical protein
MVILDSIPSGHTNIYLIGWEIYLNEYLKKVMIIMIYEDILQRVIMGEEFSFYYEGCEFWMSHNNKGYYLTNVNDRHTQAYPTGEELFKHSKINGKLLKEIWDKLEF